MRSVPRLQHRSLASAEPGCPRLRSGHLVGLRVSGSGRYQPEANTLCSISLGWGRLLDAPGALHQQLRLSFQPSTRETSRRFRRHEPKVARLSSARLKALRYPTTIQRDTSLPLNSSVLWGAPVKACKILRCLRLGGCRHRCPSRSYGCLGAEAGCPYEAGG
jgi:hypothetical protein